MKIKIVGVKVIEANELQVMIFRGESKDKSRLYVLHINKERYLLNEENVWRLQQRLTEVLARA